MIRIGRSVGTSVPSYLFDCQDDQRVQLTGKAISNVAVEQAQVWKEL